MIASNEKLVSSEKLEAATGRPRAAWHELLDAAGATAWTHPQIATWLVEVHGVDGWWAQGITVAYEQARGMRVPGQQSDGSFSSGASRTMTGDARELLARVIAVASGWAGREPASSRPEAKHPSARWSLEDGTGITATLSPVTSGAPGRVRIALTRTKLAGPDVLADEKAAMTQLLREL